MFTIPLQILEWMIAHPAIVASLLQAAKEYGPIIFDIWKKSGPVVDAVEKVAPQILPDIQKLAVAAMPKDQQNDPKKVKEMTEHVAKTFFENNYFSPQDSRFQKDER